MGAATPSLVYDADFEEAGERRAGDRRHGAAPAFQAMKLDPLFAATLVNQIARPDAPIARKYRPVPRTRAGIAVDLTI
jgi:hypothetical protein